MEGQAVSDPGKRKRGLWMEEQFGLKRVLGLPAVIAVAVGMTIGAGIFVLTGIAISFTGPSLPLAYLVSVIPVIFLMLSLAMLGSALPTTGGNYKYASRLFSPRAAFLGIWGFTGGTLVGAFPLWALSGARYLQSVFDVPAVPVAVIILTVLFVVNLLGISLAAWIQAVFVIILVMALLFFGLSGLPYVDPANFTPFFAGEGYGFIVAACLLTFTLLGSNAIVELGGEIKNPGRVIPRAFFISVFLVIVLYLLVAVVTVGVLPWTDTAGQPLTVAAGAFMSGPGFYFLVFGGGMLAVVTTLNAGFMWGTKSLLVMADDGIFPRFVAAVNRRFGTPHWFLLVVYLVSVGAVVLFGEDYLEAFANLGSIGGIIIFLPVLGAALRLPKRAPEAYEASAFKLRGAWLYLAVTAGGILSLVVLVLLLVDLWSIPGGGAFSSLFIAWLILGLIYFEFRQRALRREGRELRAVEKVDGRHF